MDKLLQNLNIFAQCRRYNVGLWLCPQFLFVVMGAVIISAILFTYVMGLRYGKPEIVALIALLLTGFLLIVRYIIVNLFERLIDARKREAAQAKELLKLKDQFIFVAVHELRTPASAIKWSIESLEKRQPSFVNLERELFNILHESNERLLVLVKNLLEVARIEGKVIKIKRVHISVAQAVTDALLELQQQIEEQNIAIHNKIPKNFPLISGDLMRLKEVFVNLLSNAIKYNQKGGEVRISAEEKNNHALICIADNGIGIKPEEQEHIFEKFWRAKNIQGVDGTGLGLFIAKQLVELMSGKIWFESKESSGTTFCIEMQISESKRREGEKLFSQEAKSSN